MTDHPSPQPDDPIAAANRCAFDAWLDDFFADYFARRPVDATFIGVHSHDHALPDCSPAGRRRAMDGMRSLRARLDRLATDGLSEAQRRDRRLAAGQLELELWEADASQFQRGNPAYYTGEAIFAVIGLFQRDAEPLDERVEAAIARMRALPEFLAQGRANVASAPAAWAERAAREARAAISYFGRGIRLLAEERGIVHPGFLPAADQARRAFEEHLAWLETDLAARPSDDYACGAEAFSRYLRAGHCLPSGQDAAWLEGQGRAALAAARDDLARRARSIDPSRGWQELLASVADDHPAVDGYYDAYRRIWNEARRAAMAADLLTWPDYPIEYVPIPASDREAAQGLYYLHYRCPAPFGRAEVHRYLVTPVEPEMPAEERERRLRAANYPTILLNHVVHHGGLGHHVQNWHAFRAASRVGRVAGVDGASRIAMFCAGTLVEGWACYATDLMEEIGALTPVEALVQAHGRLRMAARAIVDVALHTGEMTLEEAASFYEREAAMSPAAARAEAVKNSLFPGAAMMYLIGTNAIHALRRDVAAREGGAFSLRAFHDRVLRYGAIPVALIREAMLGEAATSAA